MPRSVTGSRRLRPLRAAAVAATTLIVATVALSGSPAYAINPPAIDPAAVPPDSPPGPGQPMKQNSYCTEVGVLPGTDFRLQPKYMDMLNLSEAWKFGRGAGVQVAVIDTGVTPHPRLPHLIPGGDYVMAGGDGLSDCDAHGTLVASMIAASPGSAGAPGAPGPRRPPPVPDQGTTARGAATADDQRGPAAAADHHVGAGATAGGGGQPAPACPWCPPGHQRPAELPATTTATQCCPSFSGNGHGQVVSVDYPRPAAPPPPLDPPPPPAPSDAYSGIAPDVDLISIRQSSQAFGLKDAYTGDEDPQTRQKRDNIFTMARAIVHAANMGAQVINISQVMCMSARSLIDQPDLGAAVRYAAVDKDAVIVAAAGDTSQRDCKENPLVDPLHPNDSRDWGGVTTVVTPSWFSDYVLTVGAVDSSGTPMDKLSVAGPWVSIAAPGTDVVGLSPRDDSLINAIDGPDNSLLVPSGTSFSTAIVSGVAALVRAKYPTTVRAPDHQPVDSHRAGTCSRGRQPDRLRDRRPGGRADLGCTRRVCPAEGFGEAAEAAAGPRSAQHGAGLGRRRRTGWCVAAGRSRLRRSRFDEKDSRETGMKAQREYGLSLSWARVTTVFLIDVALLVIASHLPDSWQADRNLTFWIGVGLAVIITVVALLTNGGVPVSSAPIARVRNWYADPEALTVGCTPAIDHRRQFSRETVGIREYDGQLIAVIAVDGAGEAGRHRHRDALATTIPLEAVVTSLRQFDVRLDSVDIISVGTRHSGQGRPVGRQRRLRRRSAIGARSTSATPGWCFGWTRSTTSALSPPAIRWPAPWPPPPSGWRTTWTDAAASRGR